MNTSSTSLSPLNAAYLVTWDNDLLALMTDNAFTQTHPALQILAPTTLLNALRQIAPSS